MKPVVVITGHTGRLGSALCTALLDDYTVVGLARRPLMLDRVINVTCDLAVPGAVITALDDVFDKHDVVHIIHAANACRWAKLDTLTIQNFQHGFQVGVFSAFELAQCAQRRWGSKPLSRRSLMLVSSIAALKVYGEQQALYGPMKAAQATLASQLAVQLAPLNTRVNSLLPNSFPSIVKTEAVVNRIRYYLESNESNRREALDA